ncbi:MAG: DUF3990 domain-containing protein [Treponema sp.]|nr:DUF3990 domain-containing protein [Treponema sp.]
MPEKITLYHGTIYQFETPDISKGKPFKDFGIGFYTSRDKRHAERMALRNKDIELSRIYKKDINRHIDALLYSFEFDLWNLNVLNIKEFKKADRAWMRFVIMNRTHREPEHNYDMVIGPTANDNTLTAIGLFFAGAYGEIKSDTAIDRLIEQIEPNKLPQQYFFGSMKAASLLALKSKETLP